MTDALPYAAPQRSTGPVSLEVSNDRVVLTVMPVRGLALGALGGLAGLFVSGLVHYNWGDSEVVTVFYFIMGLTLAVERFVTAVPQMGPQTQSAR